MNLIEVRRRLLIQGKGDKGGDDDLIVERGQYAINENSYIDTNTGDLVSYPGWTSTDYIDVSQGYALSEIVDATYTAFYDEQKNWIGKATTSASDATNANIIFIMPKAEVKFMRISYRSSRHPIVYTIKTGAFVIK